MHRIKAMQTFPNYRMGGEIGRVRQLIAALFLAFQYVDRSFRGYGFNIIIFLTL